MNIPSLLLSVVFLAVAAVFWRTHRTLNSPVVAYGAVWGVALLLFSLQLIAYDQPGPLAWILVLGCFLTFIFGWSLPTLMRRPAGIVSPPTPACARRIGGIDHASSSAVARMRSAFDHPQAEARLRRVLFIVGAVGLCGVVIKYLAYLTVFGSISAALEQTAAARDAIYTGSLEYSNPLVGYISSLTFTAAALAGVYAARYTAWRLAVWLPIPAVLLNDLVFYGRTWTLLGLLLVLTSYLLTLRAMNRRLSPRFKLGLSVIVALTIAWFCAVYYVRAGQTPQIEASLSPYVRMSDRVLNAPPGWLGTHIYVYATSSFAALGEFVRTWNGRLMLGLGTLAPFARGLVRLVPGAPPPPDFPPPLVAVPIETNTYTYIYPLVQDVGPFGALLIAGALGASARWLFQRATTHGSTRSLAALAFLQTALVMSTYFLAFSVGFYLIGFLAVLVVGRMADQRPKRALRLRLLDDEARPRAASAAGQTPGRAPHVFDLPDLEGHANEIRAREGTADVFDLTIDGNAESPVAPGARGRRLRSEQALDEIPDDEPAHLRSHCFDVSEFVGPARPPAATRPDPFDLDALVVEVDAYHSTIEAA